jgi:drug/metabolite transporter (DMT)-like permease
MQTPLRGIALLVAATMLFSLSDAMAKLMGRRLPVFEIAWIRYLVFLAMAVAIAARARRLRMRVRSPRLQILRGLFLVASAFLFIFALGRLPLADAAALNFTSPLMITLLAVPLLGERVGPRRWLATLVGFAGVLIVVRPNATTFEPGAIFVLMSSTSWALASVLTRRLSASDDAATTVLWSAASGLLLLTCLVPFVFIVPSAPDLAFTLLLGVIASAGQYLLVLAYSQAAASLLAPLSYVQLIWSTALGVLVFASFPDRWTILGALVIVASGLVAARSASPPVAARSALPARPEAPRGVAPPP